MEWKALFLFSLTQSHVGLFLKDWHRPPSLDNRERAAKTECLSRNLKGGLDWMDRARRTGILWRGDEEGKFRFLFGRLKESR